jgi:hypothetical protein
MLVLGCASAPRVPVQRIDVLVESDSLQRAGPLDCEASNEQGAWRFVAPGAVEVVASPSPLRIACESRDGALPEPSLTASRATAAAESAGRKASGIGAAIGAGAGVALGVVAAPVLGPAIALLLAAGSAVRGYELGGIVGVASTLGQTGYPSPIVLHLRSRQAPTEPGKAE